MSASGLAQASERTTAPLRPLCAARLLLRVDCAPALRADGSFDDPAGARWLKLLATCAMLAPFRQRLVGYRRLRDLGCSCGGEAGAEDGYATYDATYSLQEKAPGQLCRPYLCHVLSVESAIEFMSS